MQKSRGLSVSIWKEFLSTSVASAVLAFTADRSSSTMDRKSFDRQKSSADVSLLNSRPQSDETWWDVTMTSFRAEMTGSSFIFLSIYSDLPWAMQHTDCSTYSPQSKQNENRQSQKLNQSTRHLEDHLKHSSYRVLQKKMKPLRKLYRLRNGSVFLYEIFQVYSTIAVAMLFYSQFIHRHCILLGSPV